MPEKELLPVTGNSYSWEKKLDVVSRFMLLGNLRVVSEQSNIPYETLVTWKRQEWWGDLVEQIRRQKKGKTNQHITSIIEKSLEVMEDRLENGDFILNNKTGEVVRKPVSVRDANAIATGLLQRQIQLEEFIEKSEKSNDTVQETLKLLANEFQKWNRIQNKSAEDINFTEVTSALHDQRKAGLQEGSGFVHESSGRNQEEGGTEQSPPPDAESREGS